MSLTMVHQNSADSLLKQDGSVPAKNKIFTHSRLLPSMSRSHFPVYIGCQVSVRLVSQDYEGPEGDFAAGKEYFGQRFVRLSNKSNRQLNRDVYTQFVVPLPLDEALG